MNPVNNPIPHPRGKAIGSTNTNRPKKRSRLQRFTHWSILLSLSKNTGAPWTASSLTFPILVTIFSVVSLASIGHLDPQHLSAHDRGWFFFVGFPHVYWVTWLISAGPSSRNPMHVEEPFEEHTTSSQPVHKKSHQQELIATASKVVRFAIRLTRSRPRSLRSCHHHWQFAGHPDWRTSQGRS